jgi:Carboxypeptidase regulatory-like domain
VKTAKPGVKYLEGAMRTLNSAICLLAMVTACWGQTNLGTITGIISSNDTPGLANFQIQATNSESGVTVQATTSADGSYTLSDLPPGKYRILATKPSGLGTLYYDYRKTVVIEPSQALHLDIRVERFGGGVLARARERLGLPEPPLGPPPRTGDGKPDLAGVWFGVIYSDLGNPELLDGAAAVTEERLANHLRDHPAARCLPTRIVLVQARTNSVPYRHAFRKRPSDLP